MAPRNPRQAGWVSASGACDAHRLSCDDNRAGGALFVGYVLNDWLVLEGGYDYLGEVNATYRHSNASNPIPRRI